MKQCKECESIKELKDFPKEKRNVDGHRSMCKVCHNTKRRTKKESSFYADTVVGRANRMYHTAIKGAKERDIPFNLDKQWFVDKLYQGKCEVTGIPFVLKAKEHSMTVVSKGQHRNPFAPSIDRIDSSKDYSKENCQMTCVMYNFAKGSFTEEALEMFCRGYLNGA